MDVRFPDVTVKLVGTNGNAFNIIAKTIQGLKRGGATIEQADEFAKEAMSGDYNQVLQTVMKWVVVK